MLSSAFSSGAALLACSCTASVELAVELESVPPPQPPRQRRARIKVIPSAGKASSLANCLTAPIQGFRHLQAADKAKAGAHHREGNLGKVRRGGAAGADEAPAVEVQRDAADEAPFPGRLGQEGFQA